MAKWLGETPHRNRLPLVNEMADQCALCDRHREPSSEFCDIHNTAMRNLENAYSAWNKGFSGEFSREECFNKIASLSATGQSVKTVIRHLLAKEAGNQQ